MSENKMLIDAAHPEETRVVVLRGGRVEEFDYESAARKQLRGNIYLAKVTRVEPALQAAFVDYGGNRHGFLAFNEVHPDYYQIPMADRLALLEEEAAEAVAENDDDDYDLDLPGAGDGMSDSDQASEADNEDDDADDFEAAASDEDDDADADDAPDGDDPHTGRDSAAQATVSTSGGDAPGDHRQPADENERGDDRPTVLSEAMRKDETLREEPAAAGEADADEASGEAAAEVARHHTADSDADENAGADDGDADTGAAGDSRSAEDDDDDDEPAYVVETLNDDGEESEDSGDPRRRGGGRNRRSNGRRRRGGRSRRTRMRDDEVSASDDTGAVAHVGNEDALEELPSRPRRSRRSYKIQEVVKRRQVMLIQVVKEERGNKGAALTTYLSLAGRYTVLMPNTARGGGISRKITNPQDRKRLKAIAAELDVPEGMGLIIRTAGAARTKQEIKRDFEYLLRLWESVRELTLQSTAPALVYEEGDLIKRSIRDLYNKDVDQVLVAGTEAYRGAKNFMRMLMPSHAKNVIHYEDPEPLFTRHGIERQLNAMFSPYVHLPSGGYLVINQTEALVAIDVNSGRSTREFSIEETALNTNLEAADEIARQLKLRDLAGLVVIDFIDMEERRNNRKVENRVRDALRIDRARIQVGRISPFGLLEMSRQRLRTGVLEGSTTQCPHCQGTGIIRSVESVALAVLRGLEDAVMAGGRHSLIASTTAEVALYILNNKREFVVDMERRLGLPISVTSSPKMAGANFTIEKGEAPAAPIQKARADAISVDWGFDEDSDEDAPEEEVAAAEDGGGEEQPRSSRRRRRRGGRRSGERDAETRATGDAADETEADHADTADSGDDDEDAGETAEALAGEDDGEERSSRRRRRGRRGGRRNRARGRNGSDEASNADDFDSDELAAGESDGDGPDGDDQNRGDREAGEAVAPEPARDAAATASSQSVAETEAADSGAPAEQPAAEHGEPPQTSAKDTTSVAALVTPIETGTTEDARPEPEETTEAAAESPAPEATAAAGAPEEPLPVENAAPQARRSRAEPVSSEPRIERITVSPEARSNSNGHAAADSEPTEATETSAPDDKPTRRGWWQRKLLGGA